ncbi:MAG: hypothetical protein JSV67_03460 [Thermoplasmatales archaeon]|nr:MAG: hypothetical protein JSV67_03460 [Thermoplasmatales archaeon]
MTNNIFKKYLVFSIILLFIVSGIASGYNHSNTSSSCDCEKVENTYIDYNFDVDFPTMKPIPIDSINIDSSVYDITIVDTPAEFSWMNMDGKDYSTPAKSQGNCGSCGIFSAMGALESLIKIREDRDDIDPDFSEQYVLSCLPEAALIPGEGCSGGMAYMVFKRIMETTPEGNNVNGAVFESFFPYLASDDVYCSHIREGWDERLVPILDCGQISIGHDSPQNRERIKSLIMDKGPVAAYMYVPLNPNVFHQWGFENHDPTDYWPYEERTFEVLNHEIVILGWKDDISIGNGGYWICKNSWGQNWGYDGFYNIEYGALFTGYLIDWVDYDLDSFDWPDEANRPSSPIVNGPTYGGVNVEYDYTISSIDEDDDPVYYTVVWDDGTNEKYLGPYNSGEEVTLTHTWSRLGRYQIKFKAHDVWGGQSDWTTISIILPKTKTINTPFLKIIEKYNHLQPVLERLFNHLTDNIYL